MTYFDNLIEIIYFNKSQPLVRHCRSIALKIVNVCVKTIAQNLTVVFMRFGNKPWFVKFSLQVINCNI